jgi:hypothetical protein
MPVLTPDPHDQNLSLKVLEGIYVTLQFETMLYGKPMVTFF